MIIYTVYKIACLVNNKIYIGYTKKTAQQRFNEHMKSSEKEGHKYKFHRAIKKYGPINFIFEELYQTKCRKDAGKIEDNFIIEYNSIFDGYNTARGGQGGCIVLFKENPEYDAIRKKISDNHKSNSTVYRENAKKNHKLKLIGMYDKTHSDETKEKMSISGKLRIKTEVEIENAKIARNKTYSDPNYVSPNRGRARPTHVKELLNSFDKKGVKNGMAKPLLYKDKIYLTQKELCISENFTRNFVIKLIETGEIKKLPRKEVADQMDVLAV